MITYTVKSGDSLSVIARDVLGDVNLWPVIASANGIGPPYLIQPGQILLLPGSGRAPLPDPTVIDITGGQFPSAGNVDLLPLLIVLGIGSILALVTSTGRPPKPKKLSGPGYG